MTNEPRKNKSLLFVVGMSASAFLAITFIICVIWGLLVPNQAMHYAWQDFLPWFTWISWPSFFLGLIETYIYGWYFAIVFVPLYNYFSKKRG